MSFKATQTVFTINKDDVFKTSSSPEYPVGQIYNFGDIPPSPITSTTITKFIYARSDIAISKFEPGVIPYGLAIAGEESSVITATTETSPLIRTGVPQSDIGANEYGFFMIQGYTQANIGASTTVIGHLLDLTNTDTVFNPQSNPNELVMSESTRASAASITSGAHTGRIYLYDKLSTVPA